MFVCAIFFFFVPCIFVMNFKGTLFDPVYCLFGVLRPTRKIDEMFK